MAPAARLPAPARSSNSVAPRTPRAASACCSATSGLTVSVSTRSDRIRRHLLHADKARTVSPAPTSRTRDSAISAETSVRASAPLSRRLMAPRADCFRSSCVPTPSTVERAPARTGADQRRRAQTEEEHRRSIRTSPATPSGPSRAQRDERVDEPHGQQHAAVAPPTTPAGRFPSAVASTIRRARCAERDADGHLLLPRGRARDQQTGDVRRGNQQQHPDGGKEQQVVDRTSPTRSSRSGTGTDAAVLVVRQGSRARGRARRCPCRRPPRACVDAGLRRREDA